ncbi:unnamed protein product [Clavelina lepadiformis]|uniref:Uncharacterized protein n=1 Tax=Clavelina lepadiformis TaxID=159417 RepID=A0ABP0FPC4_CLALP
MQTNLDTAVQQLWNKKKIKDGIRCKMTLALRQTREDHVLTQGEIERIIYTSMLSLHGVVGVAKDYELKEYNPSTGLCTIEVSPGSASELWTALTLKSDTNDNAKCLFTLTDIKFAQVS